MLNAVIGKNVIDGTGRDPVPDGVVLIDGNRIVAVGPREQVQIPAGATTIDMSQHTVMPGLIDCHDHLAFCFELPYPAQTEDPECDIVLRAVPNSRRTIQSGVTTARVVGEKNYMDFSYKRAIDSGAFPGPRVIPSGPGIRSSFGHGVGICTTADGPDAVRAATRNTIVRGSEVIKLFVTGSGGRVGTSATTCYYSREEITACIDEAHRAGKPVAGHILGGVGARYAIEAGIDSVDHGAYIDDELIELMLKHDTWMVPTLGVYFIKRDRELEGERIRRAQTREVRGELFPKAVLAGVKIAAGTDAAHGMMAFELECMVKLGMSPKHALWAATKGAAELCRVSDSLGTLEAGKLADVVAVRGNPLEDITAMRQVEMVMKDGVLTDLSDRG